MNITSVKLAFFWSGIGKFGQYIISFGVNILMARLLTPEVFGLVGLLSVFTVVSSLLIESGFRDALIRKDIVTEEEYSSVFYLNIVISILIYFLLYFLAPYIALFYDKPILTSISRFLFLSFVINALSIVQTVHFQKQLNFKLLSKINIFSGLFSGAFGVILAFYNYGVWSLVFAYLLNVFFRTFSLWLFSNWKPIRSYNHSVIKELFNFSNKLLLSGLFAHICANITQLVIGKYYSISLVGYYDRAVNLQKIPMTTLSDVLNQVSYPLMANNTNNRKSILYILIKIIVFICVPIFLLLIVLAKDLIVFLLTEKWLPMLPYFQLLCFWGIIYPVTILNSNVLKIYNFSGIILKNEVIRNLLLLAAIFFSFKFGVLTMVLSITVINFIYPFKTFYDLDKNVYKGAFKYYTKTIFKFLSIGLFASIVVYLINFKLEFLFLKLTIRFCIGILTYLLLIYFFDKKTLKNFFNIIKNKKEITD